MATVALTSNMEDYLEAIFQLVREKPVVRVKEIAEHLGVRMPSVTAALKVLQHHHLIHHPRYGQVQLTEAGQELATAIDARHQTLVRFLVGILEVPPEDADAEACQMEHAVSEHTLNRLVRMLAFMENCPRAGPDLLRRLSRHWEGEKCDRQCRTCLQEYLMQMQERLEGEQAASKAGEV